MPIPRDPSWFSRCVSPDRYGFKKGEPCPNHAAGHYSGPGAYDPSEFVLSVVGSDFRNWEGEVCLCFGYDPRHGFWMRIVSSGEQRNVSERAIGRTYHRIHE